MQYETPITDIVHADLNRYEHNGRQGWNKRPKFGSGIVLDTEAEFRTVSRLGKYDS